MGPAISAGATRPQQGVEAWTVRDEAPDQGANGRRPRAPVWGRRDLLCGDRFRSRPPLRSFGLAGSSDRGGVVALSALLATWWGRRRDRSSARTPSAPAES